MREAWRAWPLHASLMVGAAGPHTPAAGSGEKRNSVTHPPYFSSRLRILPVAVFGRVSRNSTERGYL